MRYPTSPCPARIEVLLCPECIDARCVVVVYQDAPDNPEHVNSDQLRKVFP
jgi:hypothetical protein